MRLVPCVSELCPFAFPIPMRGNELSSVWLETVMSIVFPIPMRGNEIVDAEAFGRPDPSSQSP